MALVCPEKNKDFDAMSKSECNNGNNTTRPSSAEVDFFKDRHLTWLIAFETAFGVTFWGRNFHHFGKSDKSCFKLLRYALIASLVIYDLICVTWVMFLEYHAFSDFIYRDLFKDSSKKDTMNLIFHLAGYCYLLDYVAIKLTTVFRGLRIIEIISGIGIECQLNKINKTLYLLMYLFMILISIFHSFAFMLMFKPIYQAETELQSWIFLFIFHFFGGFIYGINKSVICSFHFYTSILICQRVTDCENNLYRVKNYGLLLEDMLRLKHKLDDLNCVLSVVMLIKMLTNGILLSLSICALEDRLHDHSLNSDTVVVLLCFFTAQLLDSVSSCYASQLIIDAMEKLVRSIQELTARHSTEQLHQACNSAEKVRGTNAVAVVSLVENQRRIDEIEYRCLQHICDMKNSICFNVMNMFDLRSMTMLLMLGNVCNYAVLLIQTK